MEDNSSANFDPIIKKNLLLMDGFIDKIFSSILIEVDNDMTKASTIIVEVLAHQIALITAHIAHHIPPIVEGTLYNLAAEVQKKINTYYVKYFEQINDEHGG